MKHRESQVTTLSRSYYIEIEGNISMDIQYNMKVTRYATGLSEPRNDDFDFSLTSVVINFDVHKLEILPLILCKNLIQKECSSTKKYF